MESVSLFGAGRSYNGCSVAMAESRRVLILCFKTYGTNAVKNTAFGTGGSLCVAARIPLMVCEIGVVTRIGCSASVLAGVNGVSLFLAGCGNSRSVIPAMLKLLGEVAVIGVFASASSAGIGGIALLEAGCGSYYGAVAMAERLFALLTNNVAASCAGSDGKSVSYAGSTVDGVNVIMTVHVAHLFGCVTNYHVVREVVGFEYCVSVGVDSLVGLKLAVLVNVPDLNIASVNAVGKLVRKSYGYESAELVKLLVAVLKHEVIDRSVADIGIGLACRLKNRSSVIIADGLCRNGNVLCVKVALNAVVKGELGSTNVNRACIFKSAAVYLCGSFTAYDSRLGPAASVLTGEGGNAALGYACIPVMIVFVIVVLRLFVGIFSAANRADVKLNALIVTGSGGFYLPIVFMYRFDFGAVYAFAVCVVTVGVVEYLIFAVISRCNAVNLNSFLALGVMTGMRNYHSLGFIAIAVNTVINSASVLGTGCGGNVNALAALTLRICMTKLRCGLGVIGISASASIGGISVLGTGCRSYNARIVAMLKLTGIFGSGFGTAGSLTFVFNLTCYGTGCGNGNGSLVPIVICNRSVGINYIITAGAGACGITLSLAGCRSYNNRRGIVVPSCKSGSIGNRSSAGTAAGGISRLGAGGRSYYYRRGVVMSQSRSGSIGNRISAGTATGGVSILGAGCNFGI